MSALLDSRLDTLPAAQRAIWHALKPAAAAGFVLYGGTAVALHLGHRQSVDFDFFRFEPLDKEALRSSFEFMRDADILHDAPDTLVVLATHPAGRVKISFFGGIGFGRVADPRRTRDGILLVASLDDLMATKLKALLDRAEAKDYRDISAMLSAGVSLAAGLSAFREMFRGEPSQVLRAIGFFEDGDLGSLDHLDRQRLRQARDDVGELPKVTIRHGSLSGL